MKLDRNINPDGKGKYALIKLRHESAIMGVVENPSGEPAIAVNDEAIDYGNTEDSEFFVIRLKDKYAAPALFAYAMAAEKDDSEWANEVLAMAVKATMMKKQIPN